MKRNSGPLVLTVGTLAYLVAVAQRSSMGAASLLAAERFQTNAEQLASLAVLQICVYAAMQIPVGFLLDRYGSRALLSFGALTMGSGQTLLAFSSNLDQAIAGRVLVGLGDAFTFISLIRLINGWYQGRRVSQLQQWLSNVGQFGQVVSAVPFAALLGLYGWQSAFLSAGAVSVLACILVVIVVRDDRISRTMTTKKLSMSDMRTQFIVNLRNPGTRFAFWVHFSTQSAATVFILLWGFPFLERAQGLERGLASSLISSMVFFGIGMGLFYGWFCGAHPRLRYHLVVTVALSIASIWLTVIFWPGRAPLWLLVALVGVIGGGAPASMIAFDFSKHYTPIERLGSANGIVNIGGFAATAISMFLIGVSLDFFQVASHSSSALFDLGAFKMAMLFQVATVLVGVWFLHREHRKLNAE